MNSPHATPVFFLNLTRSPCNILAKGTNLAQPFYPKEAVALWLALWASTRVNVNKSCCFSSYLFLSFLKYYFLAHPNKTFSLLYTFFESITTKDRNGKAVFMPALYSSAIRQSLVHLNVSKHLRGVLLLWSFYCCCFLNLIHYDIPKQANPPGASFS